MDGKVRIEGLVEGGLMLLTEARRRSEAREAGLEAGLGDESNIRLGVAVTAAHTVLEPPSMPTDELRRMGLWWDELKRGAPIPGESGEPVPVVLVTREEAVALRALVMGDAFDTDAIRSFMAKVGEA